MAKNKGKKVKEMSQPHGMVEAEAKESEGAKAEIQPTTLDQIWGDTGLWKYNTTDIEEYSRQLNEMSLADIQNHASKMGIHPTANRTNLAKKLKTEFRKHVSQYKPIEVAQDEEDEVSLEVRKILEEGQ